MSKTDKPSPTPAKPGKPDAARRALLRGAAVGIPSVVTLASGSAWGAVNSIACFDATYAGKFSTATSGPNNGKLVFNVAVPGPGGTVNVAGTPVTQSTVSQFCWASGGTPGYSELPP